MVGGWKKRHISLPFRVGDLALADLKIDAAVMTTPYSELSPNISESYPKDVLRDLETSVAVIHSCPIDGEPARLSIQSGGIRYVPSCFPRHHTELTGEFDEYLKGQFSSKSRSTLIRKVKKQAKRTGGTLDVREYCEPDQMAEWHKLAREVSAKTYQETLLKRGLPESDRFVSEITEQAATGLFRGYLLFENETPIAYLACPITEGGALIYDFVGHDPEYKKLSPGTVLLYAVLERAFGDDSLCMFDFTEGDGAHKERFATHQTACADVWFFAPTPKNVAMVVAHAAIDQAQSLSIAALDRIGLKERIKKFVRNSG